VVERRVGPPYERLHTPVEDVEAHRRSAHDSPAQRIPPRPAWTAAELGKRSSIERFFGRVLIFFRLQRPPVFGWSAVETRVALSYAAVWVIALAAWQAGHPELIRSPRLVLAHVWDGPWA
jgi:hypothetical protein